MDGANLKQPSCETRIREAVDRARRDPRSTTSLNQRSVPAAGRDGLAILADAGGVLVLLPTGRLVVFDHRRQECPVDDWVRRAGLAELSRQHPELVELVVPDERMDSDEGQVP